ncbi:MAG: YhjD/YihY/BrkB family envelope integrity protein [bacterium]
MTRWRNLGSFARSVVARFLDDDCPLTAASIAYYALLSIFPFLLAIAAILAHFLEEARVWAAIHDALCTYLSPRARAASLAMAVARSPLPLRSCSREGGTLRSGDSPGLPNTISSMDQIAGIIIFLLWMYFVAMILLLGAEISRCRAFSH